MKDNEIYIIDLETTGLSPYPTDYPVEICLGKINIDDEKYTEILNTLVIPPEPSKLKGILKQLHNKSMVQKINNSYWTKYLGGSTYDEIVEKGRPFFDVFREIFNTIDEESILSWNVDFDIGLYLNNIRAKHYKEIHYQVLKCPMVVATDIIKIPHSYYQYKFPKLAEASEYYEIYVDTDGYDYHRAGYDVAVTAETVLEMIRRGDYIL